MADGKWIDGLTPNVPVERAAAAVLSARLATVSRHLPLAVEQADADVEHVHQLRVATRRAGAALSTFRELLPKKSYKRAKGVMRALRRAAGDARDWDVFLEMLAESEALKGASARPAVDFLSGYGFGQRAPAQANLVRVAAEQSGQLAIVVSELPKETKPLEQPRSLAGLGTALLPGLINEFVSRVESAPAEPTELHQLRIVGKRLRYAMEVFATCFAPAFRESLYPTVEQVQSVLGAVQDGHVALERLSAIEERLHQSRPAIAKRVRAGLHGLMTEIRKRTASEKRAFGRWMRNWNKLSQTLPLAELLTPIT